MFNHCEFMSVHIDLRGFKYLSVYIPLDEEPLTVKDALSYNIVTKDG